MTVSAASPKGCINDLWWLFIEMTSHQTRKLLVRCSRLRGRALPSTSSISGEVLGEDERQQEVSAAPV